LSAVDRPTPRPTITRIYETILYGDDPPALAAFYRDVLGLRVVEEWSELGAALRTPDGAMLLLFNPVLAAREGRPVPSHGATGPGHIAFTVPAGQLAAWRDELPGRGVEIEREVEWGERARSLYIRDPAGNSVELTEDELWAP
jgi:catechol 2,3-dioxygenase-like lactoylglutathione lyase family enzyme